MNDEAKKIDLPQWPLMSECVSRHSPAGANINTLQEFEKYISSVYSKFSDESTEFKIVLSKKEVEMLRDLKNNNYSPLYLPRHLVQVATKVFDQIV